MKMKKIHYALLGIMLAFQVSFSQTKVVKGVVTSSTDGATLPGVNVVVKGTTKTASTGFDGGYKIQASENDILVFSFLGFASKEVSVTSSEINVFLKEEVQSLKEVVVGALGVKRTKASQGYATQTVSGADIVNTQRTNFVNALQGRVAGLGVTSTSGAPGSSAVIQLRGVNSLSGINSPLFIIDGLPVSNETLNQGLFISDAPNRQQDYTNRGADINPDDIESLTVLKGPEAAALYGIEASNGAIVITTKKGKKGKGTITYSNNTRLEDVYLFPKAQRVYQRGENGINNTIYRRHFGRKYDAGTKLYDNLENFFQTGVTQQHNLTFDGGSDVATYRLALANLNQTGVVPNSTYERLNLSLNGTVKISEKLKSEAFFAYTRSSNRKASKGGGGFLTTLLAWPADVDVRDYANVDGTRKRITDGTLDTELDNPFWDVNKNINEDFNNRMVVNSSIIYDPMPWLNITGRLGFDLTSGQGFRSIHPESQLGISTGGFIESYYNSTNILNSNFFVTARKSLGKLNAKLLVGNSVDENTKRIFSTQGTKFFETNFNSINNTDATTQRSQERIIKRRLIGFFSEASFDIDKILYLNLTGRLDWSSTLPKDKNPFPTYSASASFVFTEIKGLKDNYFLSYGKLRASKASVAKIPDPYSIDPTFQPKFTTGGGYGYGVTGGNPNLNVEFLKSTEFGTELKFLNNRIGLDVAVYRAETEDPIIKNIRLSYGTGFIVTNLNFGALRNEGLEVTLNVNPIKTENFTWNTNINFTKTRSELLSLPSSLPEYYVSDTWLFSNVRGGTRVGEPLTTFTGWTYLKNDKGDILIDPATGNPLQDQTFPIVGDRNPDFVIGLLNSFTYKNFTMSFLLDIRKGGDVFNGNELFLYQQGLSERTLDREQPRIVRGVLRDGLQNTANPTQNNIQINPYYQSDYYRLGAVPSDFIEKDINWLRMRDITLSYNLPSAMLKRTNFFDSVSFNVTLTDMFMFTNYTGADPAVNGLNASTGGAGGVGFDYGALSTPRGINLGLKIGI
jgi:TonB-linked SusC/RagA family outer membrane protein